jgi:hypothetical protein
MRIQVTQTDGQTCYQVVEEKHENRIEIEIGKDVFVLDNKEPESWPTLTQDQQYSRRHKSLTDGIWIAHYSYDTTIDTCGGMGWKETTESFLYCFHPVTHTWVDWCSLGHLVSWAIDRASVAETFSELDKESKVAK